MDGKAKVRNFTKLPLLSFLESSWDKFDAATGRVINLQLYKESEAEKTEREWWKRSTMLEEEN